MSSRFATTYGEFKMASEASLATNKETLPVRDAVFDLLRELGIRTIFGNPGCTELAFLTPWPADLRYVLALQEASAVAMADAYAQATGNAAFVNLHSAAGLGNGLGTLYTAFRSQSPLIVTAGQQTRDLLPYDPYLGAERATEFPRPYVKWACEPARAEDVPVAMPRLTPLPWNVRAARYSCRSLRTIGTNLRYACTHSDTAGTWRRLRTASLDWRMRWLQPRNPHL
jgi:hypothetical protein